MFVKFRTFENFCKNRNSKISQSSLKLKLEIIIDQDSNMRAFTYDVTDDEKKDEYSELMLNNYILNIFAIVF